MQQRQFSAQNPHVEALRAKHSMLARRIEDAQKSPTADELTLRQLKINKLRLKDEISQREQHTG
jgi:hypothetical protein